MGVRLRLLSTEAFQLTKISAARARTATPASEASTRGRWAGEWWRAQRIGRARAVTSAALAIRAVASSANATPVQQVAQQAMTSAAAAATRAGAGRRTRDSAAEAATNSRAKAG